MEGHGVYITRDGGASWSPFALAGQSINALAWAHTDWTWVGTEDGLWRLAAQDGAAQQVAGADATVMSVAATTQGRVAMGLYGGGLWLTDDGHTPSGAANWQQPEVALHAPPVVTSSDEQLFALDGDGEIAHSEDGGALWRAPQQAPPAMAYALDSVRVVTPDGAALAVVFAALESGVARWDAATGAWIAAGDDASHAAALGIALSPNFGEDHTLLALGHESSLRLSHDDGATWQSITGPWRAQSLLQARVGPDSGRSLLAISVQPAETGHFALTVWESGDQGATWEVLAGLTSGVPAILLAWPHDATESALFLATQHRVIKLFQTGDPPTLQVHQYLFEEGVRVTALATAADYDRSQVVWAATSGGLYRSVDRGVTWAPILDLPLGFPVVWLQVTASHVNAITLGGRVWRAAL
jgi:hypothetical protein